MVRKTYHYDEDLKQMVEGPAPRRGEASGDGWRFSDRHYAGLQATDGTDISTRKRHREYMKRNNLTTVDDFTNTWKEAAQKRAEFFTGSDKRESEQRKRDIADAITRRSRHG